MCDVACCVSDVLLKLFRHFLLPRAKKNVTSLCRRPRKKKSSWRQFGISDARRKISESLAVFAEVLRRFPCFLHFVQWFFRVWHMWKMPSSFYELVRQQKLRRRMSWPPRRSIWKMRKRPLAGKHYETAWKLGFLWILEWPTFSESLLGWARLM